MAGGRRWLLLAGAGAGAVAVAVAGVGAWHADREAERSEALCAQPDGRHAVQVLHALPAGASESESHDDIVDAVADADFYLASSGPGHRIRWACRGGEIHVERVTSPAPGNDGAVTFAEIVEAAVETGYDRPDRIYAIYYASGQGYDEVGEATGSGDRSQGPQYALIAQWTGFWTLHELGHTFGAVPGPAPHQYAKGHCLELNDVMCRRIQDLDDPAYADIVRVNCPDSPEWLFDCNHDDYYLHDGDWWDVADSSYLYLDRKHRPSPAPRPSPVFVGPRSG
jgi:hypothetical protein